MLRVINAFLIFCAAALLLYIPVKSHAEETTVERIQSDIGDVKVDAKQKVRKINRKYRNARGHRSILKDTKDAVNNTTDSASNAAKKAKRKMD